MDDITTVSDNDDIIDCNNRFFAWNHSMPLTTRVHACNQRAIS
jgi:hypothetical protein